MSRRKVENEKSIVVKAALFFGSLTFAITLLTIFALLCLLGLLIPQNQPLAFYANKYGTMSARIIHFLRINDAYHSPILIITIILICVSIVICILKKRKLKIATIGTFLNHLSIIVLLLGVLIGFLWGTEGGIQLYVGDLTDSFISAKGITEYLPFSIQLDDFILERYDEPVSHLYAEQSENGKGDKRFTIKKGDNLRNILGSGISLKIEEIFRNKTLTTDIYEPDEINDLPYVLDHLHTDSPAVRFTAIAHDGKEFPSFLIGRKGEYYTFLNDDTFLRFVHVDTEETYAEFTNFEDDFFASFHTNLVNEINTVTILSASPPLQSVVISSLTSGEKKTEPLALSEIYTIKPDLLSIRIDRLLKQAVVVTRLHDEPEQSVLKITLNQSNESIHIPSDEMVDIDGLLIGYQSEFPISQFISHLTIIDKDVHLQKSIRVNSPLTYRKYTFYQSSYDQESSPPQWSGLKVSKDPGIALVYIGLLLFSVGLLTKFYLLPSRPPKNKKQPPTEV